MDNAARLYIKTVLDLYISLPQTPARFSRSDYALALKLFQSSLPLSTVESALLLASARRIYRPADAPPLGSIRSLHYFLPVIEEITQQPLPPGYLEYLRHKLQARLRRPLSIPNTSSKL